VVSVLFGICKIMGSTNHTICLFYILIIFYRLAPNWTYLLLCPSDVENLIFICGDFDKIKSALKAICEHNFV
jgi:hypothetical protein